MTKKKLAFSFHTRVQPILWKDSANERNDKEKASFLALNITTGGEENGVNLRIKKYLVRTSACLHSKCRLGFAVRKVWLLLGSFVRKV